MTATRALPRAPRRPARGAALLTAMLTVTLVATFAATALWQQWRAVEIETAERARSQAGWILLGALDWSRVVLREDGRSGGPDHLAEPWAVPLQEAKLSTFLAAQGNVSQVDDASSETSNAFLSGEIIDLQSRMNLRNLLQKNEAIDLAFSRLFERLGLPASALQQISVALRSAQTAGSNDESTAPLMPRTLAQLGWLGISPDVIARLEPHATLLPSATPINLNTASPEVIWACVEGLDWAAANQFVQSREASPVRTVPEALQRLNMPASTASGLLAFSTSYFEIRGRLRLGETLVSERSLVHRNGMTVVTLWRERGHWTSPNLPLPEPATARNSPL